VRSQFPPTVNLLCNAHCTRICFATHNVCENLLCYALRPIPTSLATYSACPLLYMNTNSHFISLRFLAAYFECQLPFMYKNTHFISHLFSQRIPLSAPRPMAYFIQPLSTGLYKTLHSLCVCLSRLSLYYPSFILFQT